MSTTYAVLRRSLGQRLNMWGGDVSSDGPAKTTAASTSNTLIDTNRPEPDDEWDSAWIVLNPGSADQVNSPTIWRRVSDNLGYVQSTGTLTIMGSWPTPYGNGVPINTQYELFKTFRPENWLQGVNWALTNSYPYRHLRVTFEVPQDYNSRIINVGALVKNLSLSNPVAAPTVVELADGQGMFVPG